MKPTNNLFLICLLVFLLNNLNLFSQSEPTKNWEEALSEATGQKRVDLLLKLSEDLAAEDLNLADSLAKEGITLASQLGDSLTMHRIGVNLGKLCISLKKADEGINWVQQSLNYFSRDKNLAIEKAKCQLTLASLYVLKKNYHQADSLLTDSEPIFKNIKDTLWQSKVLSTKGYLYFYKKEHETAIMYYTEALKIGKNLEKINHIANIKYNLAALKRLQGLHPEAMELHLQVISMECEDRIKAKSYTDIGTLYMLFKDWDPAIKYIKKSIELKQKIGLEASLAYSFYFLGLTYQRQDNFGEALKYYDKSLTLSKRYNIHRKISDILGGMGNIYYKLGDTEKGKHYYNKQLELAIAQNDWGGIYLVNYNLGFHAYEAGKFDEALEYVLKSYEILKYKDDIMKKLKTHQLLGLIYLGMNNKEKLKYHKGLYLLYNDSINSTRKVKQIGALEQKQIYENQKDSLNISRKEKIFESRQNGFFDKKKNIATALIFLSIVTGVIFVIFIKKQKKENIPEKSESSDREKMDQYFEEMFTRFIQNKTILENDKNELPNPNVAQIYNMTEFLKSNLSSKGDWASFENYFQKIHKDFFKNLKSTYPNISINELNMCALLKLNLRSKDIAQIMGISPDSVRKAQNRLSKKLNLPPSEILRDFVLKL